MSQQNKPHKSAEQIKKREVMIERERERERERKRKREKKK